MCPSSCCCSRWKTSEATEEKKSRETSLLLMLNSCYTIRMLMMEIEKRQPVMKKWKWKVKKSKFRIDIKWIPKDVRTKWRQEQEGRRRTLWVNLFSHSHFTFSPGSCLESWTQFVEMCFKEKSSWIPVNGEGERDSDYTTCVSNTCLFSFHRPFICLFILRTVFGCVCLRLLFFYLCSSR